MKKVMIIGNKESFTVKILVKKVYEAGTDCGYVPWNIGDISARWEDTGAAVICMEGGERPSDDVLAYLAEKMTGKGSKMILVGDSEDISYVTRKVPEEKIYRSFVRPVDNNQFVNTISELMSRVESGEFRKKILVVDDDPNYLGLVREWLKDKYTITGVSSGLQAIKWLGKNKADLILLDYEMPVTSGSQVLEMLRSDDDTKNIPVIFLTGKSDRESVVAVLSMKPDGYFLKSIGKNELTSRLEEFFSHRS